jgi:hypothetical protein
VKQDLPIKCPNLTHVAGLQGTIALPDRANIAHPVVRKGVFHVEHAPVQPTAATVCAVLHEAVKTGIEDLHRKKPGELGEGRKGGSPSLGRGPVDLGDLDPDDLTARRREVTHDPQKHSATRYKLLRIARAERSTPSQQKDPLKKRRLPGTIRPIDQVQAAPELHINSS